MSVFEWIVVGVACGLLGHRLWTHEGAACDIAYGISGALVGGVLFSHAADGAPPAFVGGMSLPMALAGAASALLLARFLCARRAPKA